MKQVLRLSVLGLFTLANFACTSNDPADEMLQSTGGQSGDRAGNPGSGGARPDEPNEMGGAGERAELPQAVGRQTVAQGETTLALNLCPHSLHKGI